MKIIDMNIQDVWKMVKDFKEETGRGVACINISNGQLNRIIRNTEHPDVYHYPTSGRIRVNNVKFNVGNYEECEDSLEFICCN